MNTRKKRKRRKKVKYEMEKMKGEKEGKMSYGQDERGSRMRNIIRKDANILIFTFPSSYKMINSTKLN